MDGQRPGILLAISVLADFRRREAGGPVSRILAWEWRGIASRTGQPGRDGRKLLVCMIEAVEILKVKRLYRTYC